MNNPKKRKAELFKETGGRCVYCGEIPEIKTFDHIIPKVNGGNNSLENLLPACHPCNFYRKWGKASSLAHPDFYQYVKDKEKNLPEIGESDKDILLQYLKVDLHSRLSGEDNRVNNICIKRIKKQIERLDSKI